MWLLLPTLALASTPVLEVEQGRLARVGETVGGARVERIEQHPEYDRMVLRLAEGEALTVELSLFRGGTPACEADGTAIFPRLDLSPGLPPAQAAAPVAALCDRLAASDVRLDLKDIRSGQATGQANGEGPTVQAGGSGEEEIHIPGTSTGRFRPLQALLLGMLLLLPLARLRPDGAPLRDGLGLLALAALARLLLSPLGIQIAPDAGYETLVMAWGMHEPHALYSDGFSALHAPLQQLSDYDPQLIFLTHGLLSALSAPLLWLVASHVLRERWSALFTGACLAMLPVALRLAGSELSHVPLAFFELLAVLAALSARGSLPAGLLAALATGFVVHLRPEALPFAGLPAALLLLAARERRWTLVPLLLLLGLGVQRALTLPAIEAQGPIQMAAFLSPRFWVQVMWPRLGAQEEHSGAFQVFLDLGITPFFLPLLALAGLVQGFRHNRPALLLALSWAGLTVGPVLPKAWPMLDAWRLQLPGQAPMILLAGLGLGLLPRGRRIMTLAPLMVLPLFLHPIRERWAGMEEWNLMHEALPALPPGARVLFADHEAHARAVAQVGALLQHRAGAEPWWLPMGPFAASPDPGPDLYAWEGLTCRIDRLPSRRVDNDLPVNSCLQLRERCTLTPWRTARVTSRTDADIRIPEGTEVGLYRIDGCR